MKNKMYRVIYSEVLQKYLAQSQVSYVGWTDEKLENGRLCSEAVNIEKWLKIGDWVYTLKEAKYNILGDMETDKSQRSALVVYEYEEKYDKDWQAE